MNADSMGVILNPVPNGLRPRSFYSVDRRSLYWAMGFRTKDRVGDPKLPTRSRWEDLIKSIKARIKSSGESIFMDKVVVLNEDPSAWDFNSITFEPLDVFNCHVEYIDDPRFDGVRDEIREVAIKLYGIDSMRARNVRPMSHYPYEKCWIGRLKVKLMPPYLPKDHRTDQVKRKIEGGKGHSFQRVLVQCPHCTRWQYFGRLNQHMYPSFSSMERSKICVAGEKELKED